MELVIKIPEHYYENNIKNDLPIYLTEDNVIKILPKEHGRLIILSEDELKNNQIDVDFSPRKWVGEVGIEKATVAIIEADTESEE